MVLNYFYIYLMKEKHLYFFLGQMDYKYCTSHNINLDTLPTLPYRERKGRADVLQPIGSSSVQTPDVCTPRNRSWCR